MPKITKLVITGGPCGGKSTALSKIEKYFTCLGYRVVFIGETATEMMKNGVAPWIGTNTDFQIALLNMQRSKEEIYTHWANQLDDTHVLLVCDRGALDSKAYMSEEEFAVVLSALQENEIELRDKYDAVFHLVTAANGAEEFYSTANNTTRTEAAATAVTIDNKLIAAWTGHPHLRVIDNSSTFEEKIQRLLLEIASFLGEPEPYEIERKFLIAYPDLAFLETLPNCAKVDIIQTYLCSNHPNTEKRVRQRGRYGQYIFTETTKKRISEVKRIETERRITQTEYLALLMSADTTLRQIKKTRYCLSYANQYLEVDVYPFWQNCAILEVEMSDENKEIVFPDYIHVLREVTEELSYSNRMLAACIPNEIK